MTDPEQNHVDVLIVGAGLSGVGAACALARTCPDRSVLVVEARDDLGGTWDLFRYPGVRSDSDMNTLGYTFRPWTDPVAIADGPSILSYIRDTAEEFGVTERIRYRHRVKRAQWNSERARWTVEISRGGGGGKEGAPEGEDTVALTCSFLYLCTGYYDYDTGYQPDFPGVDTFEGELVHPQHWPTDLDYADKRVVVIGSGATAVTLVPAMARDAAHVTMLQRSPTYILAGPRRDRTAALLGRYVGQDRAAPVVFWKNVLRSLGQYELSRRRPTLVAGLVRKDAARQLPPGFDVARHLTPTYKPWDQRMCLAPDGDLFEVIRSGRASMETDTIETFTPNGIRLSSGREIEADVVVSATGLTLLSMGGIDLEVDGAKVDIGSTVAYKAMMLCGVPNFAWTVGYTNASWTLKADLVARYVCRLLSYMAERGYSIAEPQAPRTEDTLPMVDLASGYVRRGIANFPKQGVEEPWRLKQNYVADLWSLRRDTPTDHMRFATRGETST
ncbi:flavin-containing monooxygenase [Streptomyces spongiae]|uniref:NAD(P)/FAD-dependent oxidoreductase n=1 Tax=Streptomyces spongiae TaxID=565072 RepID=A0A5N8XAY8_9ACTN|nr:NAD(P)/FAD-dependent oxidoreductase [Streptomyces spongiae]MPY56557.1 NAD(P)/FAD-dependent oxidoreductase [Streptomyces spongiae]